MCVFMQEGICVSGDREVGGTERGSFMAGCVCSCDGMSVCVLGS